MKLRCRGGAGGGIYNIPAPKRKKEKKKDNSARWNRKPSIENKCLRRMEGIDNLNANSCAEKMEFIFLGLIRSF